MNISKIGATVKGAAYNAQKAAIKSVFSPIGISSNKNLQEQLRVIEQKNLIRDKVSKITKPITDFISKKIFKF